MVDLTRYIGTKFHCLTVIEEFYKNNVLTCRCLCECGNEHICRTGNLQSGTTKSCGCLPSKTIRECLIGNVYGQLIVVAQAARLNNRGNSRWLCVCDCGGTTTTTGTSLKLGLTRSCGCLHRGRPLADITNNIFGRLTAIAAQEKRGGKWYWLCKCVCGKEAVVSISKLRSGYTKSCGCIHIDRLKAMTGENNPSYKPELTAEDRLCRKMLPGAKEWAIKVKELAGFTCLVCGTKKTPFNSHHLEAHHANPELRLDLDNGVCMCTNCHIEFHKIYGQNDSTTWQFLEFINTREAA